MNDNLISEIIDLNKVKMNLLELQKMWEQLIATMAAKSSKDLSLMIWLKIKNGNDCGG